MILLSLPGWTATLINDTETEELIYELVKPLADAAGIPGGRLKIHILNDDTFNAFVAGGEDVYVNTGLIMKIKNPDAFQAVIAHELGHMQGGHMAQMADRISAEMKRTMLIQALGVGLMVAGGDPSMGAGVLAGAGGVAQQSVMAFTRDEERIADNMGFDLMVNAGQNPNGFITVFEQMYDMTGVAEEKINPNHVNHPLTTERLNNIKSRMQNLDAPTDVSADVAARRNAEFELVRAKLIGYIERDGRIRELYPYTDKSDAALYARAIANMRGGNLDGARMGAMTLISRKPKNPYFLELLGDIEYQFGHYDDSVRAYERALDILDNAPQVETALALVLAERNKPDDNARAIELCKRAILNTPMPMAYWVLARAYGEDDAGRHAWAMAEYYKMIGKDSDAKQYAKRAQKHLKKTDAEYIKAGDIIK